MENIQTFLDKTCLEEIINKYYMENLELHIQQVTKLSLKFFDLLDHELNFPKEERDLLEYSALLHDIGHFFHEKRHDRHTRYIITHDKLFDELPQSLRSALALIAGGHGKSMGTNIKRHSREEQGIILKLTAILRIADALDALHQSDMDILGLRWAGQDLVLVIQGSDLKGILDKLQQKSSLFEKVFNRKLLFTLEE